MRYRCSSEKSSARPADSCVLFWGVLRRVMGRSIDPIQSNQSPSSAEQVRSALLYPFVIAHTCSRTVSQLS
jgi:hypothetical protein